MAGEASNRHVAISGTGGLVGSHLQAAMADAGWTVHPLTRSRSDDGTSIYWPEDSHHLDPASVEGLDAVVHLAGESVIGRWTAAKKQAIRESRVPRTRHLARTLSRLERRPAVLVTASAIGYYGSRGEQALSEADGPGSGFLAEVAREWEEATHPARDAGIRTIMLRLGVVLSREGGALANVLPVFKLGGGGTLGDGSQWWSWIALDDVVRAIRFAIDTPDLEGPVNLVAPESVTNRTFTKTLGRILHRPTLIPVPPTALRLTMGEMADEMLLASQRVEPTKLLQHNFHFEHPSLEPALRAML